MQNCIHAFSSLCLLILILRVLPSKHIVNNMSIQLDRIIKKIEAPEVISTVTQYSFPILVLLKNVRRITLSNRFFSSIVLSPVIEELVFRGYLCNLISSRLTPVYGMLANSACFCFLHLYSFSKSDSFLLFLLRVFEKFMYYLLGFL